MSAETDPGRQLPYFVSGGLGGLALVFLGSALLVADQIDAAAKGRGRLDRQVEELHTLIVAAASVPAPAVTTVADQAAGGQNDGGLFAVPAGRTYHRRSCEMIASKPAQPVDSAQIAARGLTPCTICEPKIAA